MDADVVRKFFMTDKAQSHLEMSGYFELVFQYRELNNAKGAGQLQEKELGIMRDMDSKNKPHVTIIAKQARKRLLEFTSSGQSQFGSCETRGTTPGRFVFERGRQWSCH